MQALKGHVTCTCSNPKWVRYSLKFDLSVDMNRRKRPPENRDNE